MSTDIDTCALIAAAIESIDKVGPFDSHFKLEAIDDVRASKKEDIVKRAKEIKQRCATKTVSEGETMLKDVHEGDSGKLTTYGPSKLTCSSGVFDSNWIILVEGRADVINLLRAGYDNVVAIDADGGCVEVIDQNQLEKRAHGRFDRLYTKALDIRSIGGSDYLLVNGIDSLCTNEKKVGRKKKKSVRVT